MYSSDSKLNMMGSSPNRNWGKFSKLFMESVKKIRLCYQIYFDVSFNPDISHAFSDLQKKKKIVINETLVLLLNVLSEMGFGITQ